MREYLKISVPMKEILIYAILNKMIMFSRIPSRLVRISLYNFPRLPQNSTSLGQKVLSWAKLAISGRFYFCARKLIYFRILNSWIHIWRGKCSTVLQNFPSPGKNVENFEKIEVSCRHFSYEKAVIFPSSELPCSFLSSEFLSSS